MPSRKQSLKSRSIDLALQGGGSHGAFTWGVLDRLLRPGTPDTPDEIADRIIEITFNAKLVGEHRFCAKADREGTRAAR